jgi:Flp pilus assembly protein TadD
LAEVSVMRRLIFPTIDLATSGHACVQGAVALVLAIGLAGCEPILTPTPVADSVTAQKPGDVKYYPSDEPVKLGIQRFYEGNFGLAQQYFQDAVEKTPKDATAWVGLAASYDRLGRFDLADRSYAAAVKLVGHTPSILNNEGYSYMLRGDLRKARSKFDAALRKDPGNATANNNLALLNQSVKFVERASDGEPCGSVDCGQ